MWTYLRKQQIGRNHILTAYSYTVVEGPPSKYFNKLDTSFAKVSIPDLESKCCNESDEVQATGEEVEIGSDDNGRTLVDSVDKDGMNLEGGKNWKISKYVDRKLTYIHISQAIKLLLPREYVSRCRQKRQWASKYLPGKEPLNPTHDIFKYWVIVKKSSPKNLLADCRSTVGRQSADCWSSVGRQLADCRPFVGRQTADRRPTGFARNIGYLSADSRPTVGRQSVDSWPTVGNVSVTCR